MTVSWREVRVKREHGTPVFGFSRAGTIMGAPDPSRSARVSEVQMGVSADPPENDQDAPGPGARARKSSENFLRPSKRRLVVLSEEHQAILAEMGPLPTRPATRAECLPGGTNEARPCPFASCKFHLYLDVHPRTGNITYPRGDVAPEDLDLIPETCALDVADQGETILEDLGKILNLTKERARQLEAEILRKLYLVDAAVVAFEGLPDDRRERDGR